MRLGEQKPGCVVLDCYHELSAVCWAQSVQKLLRMCPQAKVLGLGVPNGAPSAPPRRSCLPTASSPT